MGYFELFGLLFTPTSGHAAHTCFSDDWIDRCSRRGRSYRRRKRCRQRRRTFGPSFGGRRRRRRRDFWFCVDKRVQER